MDKSLNLLDRISTDPDICHGKPCIRGTLYLVETILELVNGGKNMDTTRLVESAQYVTNYGGQQTAVILPIDIWDRLLEVLQNDEEQTKGVENRIMEDDGIPSVAEVVARIKAMPPNPAMIRQPQGTFVDNSRHDPEFDLEAWKQEWAFAEEELRRVNCGNNRNNSQV